VVPQPVRWHGRVLAGLAYASIQAVQATLRFQWEDHSGLFRDGTNEPVIFSIWHNRLALSLVIYRRYVLRHSPGRRMAALVSASRDGGVLARVLEHFGVQPVRGSSSRRGPQALLELTSWAERGYDLAITPDGPRGPCGVVQEGVLSLAQLTGQPIVPVTYHLNRKFRLKSWDRFQVPLAFAICAVTLGAPLRVPRKASDSEREKLRQELETAMRSITRD
jgi:hypothetical protein